MSNSIYPCLWFDHEAHDAARFYSTVFEKAHIAYETGFLAMLQLPGLKIMLMNGGPTYKLSPAMSYYVYCGNEASINSYYALLKEGGELFMPLDSYHWSEKYAWVQDKYGVSWQLDIHDINSDQKVVPTLLFANEKRELVKNATSHYSGIFSDSKILLESPYPPGSGMPEGTLLFTQFKLDGFIFNAMSSAIPHDFDFTPANSMVIECDTQEEIDHFWEALGVGGKFDRCGWLADKYDVSWQIIPSVLPGLMRDPEKAPRVAAVFMQMQKLEIAPILNLFENGK
jgi:predicted 3-demethylubiquinone-9 3-methyltransferase (glyoxalase superfamily)